MKPALAALTLLTLAALWLCRPRERGSVVERCRGAGM